MSKPPPSASKGVARDVWSWRGPHVGVGSLPNGWSGVRDLIDDLGAELARSSSAVSRPSVSASGSSGWQTSSAVAPAASVGADPDGRVCWIASRADATASGSVAAAAVGRSGGPSAGRAGAGDGRSTGAARLGHRTCEGARSGLRAGVDQGLDLPVRTDDVDRRLPQDLVAPPAQEGVARAGVAEPEGQHVAVHRDDLGVLGQVHPRHPSPHLGRLDDVGPQPAYVDQAQRARQRRSSWQRGCAGTVGAARGGAGASPARCRRRGRRDADGAAGPRRTPRPRQARGSRRAVGATVSPAALTTGGAGVTCAVR